MKIHPLYLWGQSGVPHLPLSAFFSSHGVKNKHRQLSIDIPARNYPSTTSIGVLRSTCSFFFLSNQTFGGLPTSYQIHILERMLREVFLLWPQGNPRLIPLRAARPLTSQIHRDVSSLHNDMLCNSNSGSLNQRYPPGQIPNNFISISSVRSGKLCDVHGCNT